MKTIDRRRATRILAAGLVGSVAELATGCATSRRLLTPRKTTMTDHLAIRDGYTHPITRISQEQGEKEIGILVNSPHTQQEENWLHEGITNSDHSVWRDISIEQQLCTSQIDYQFIKRELRYKEPGMMHIGEKMSYTWHHMHPLTTIEQRYKDAIQNVIDRHAPGYKPEDLGIPREWVMDASKIELLAMPSTGDILVHLKLEKILDKMGFELQPTRLTMPTGTYVFKPSAKMDRSYTRKQKKMLEHMRNCAFFAGLGVKLPGFEESRRRKRENSKKSRREIEELTDNFARDARLEPALKHLREHGLEIEYHKKRNIPDVIARL